MAGLKKKRRIQLIIAGLVLLAGSSALMGYALRDGIEFFRSPSEIVEDPPKVGERFRVGGLVAVGSLVRGASEEVTFVVTDGATSIDVSFTGILPDLFGEGQGMIALGTMVDDVFIATEVLAKHDEEYMPKEVVDILKENGTYVDPNDG